jgi:hypothetical protein
VFEAAAASATGPTTRWAIPIDLGTPDVGGMIEELLHEQKQSPRMARGYLDFPEQDSVKLEMLAADSNDFWIGRVVGALKPKRHPRIDALQVVKQRCFLHARSQDQHLPA